MRKYIKLLIIAAVLTVGPATFAQADTCCKEDADCCKPGNMPCCKK